MNEDPEQRLRQEFRAAGQRSLPWHVFVGLTGAVLMTVYVAEAPQLGMVLYPLWMTAHTAVWATINTAGLARQMWRYRRWRWVMVGCPCAWMTASLVAGWLVAL